MNGLVQINNRWRDAYNPLRGLTIARAVALLEQGQSGDYADLHWCYKFVEETDADVFALLDRRLSSIAEMDWTIKTVNEETNGFNRQLADDQAGALRETYEQIDNLTEAIEHLETSAFRGFAFCQAQGTADGFRHLEILDSWNFLRDGMRGDWYWNPRADSTTAKALGDGALLNLDRDRLICLETERHIDRLGLIKFVRANLSEKDWDSFIEIFGIPLPIITGPEDVAAGDVEKYQADAEKVAAAATGYLPYGSTVSYPNAARSMSPFNPRLDWLSKKLILAGTGGMLTMLAEGGSGTLAGNAHTETFKSIARCRAAKISEKLQLTTDRFTLNRKFEGRPRLAYFDIAAKEEQDVGDIIEHAAKLPAAGYRMKKEQLEEKTGYQLEIYDKPEAAVENSGPAEHRRSFVFHAKREPDTILTALHKDLQPLRSRIEKALQMESDQEMSAELRRIAADAPALYRAAADSGLLEEALGMEAAAAFVEGMENPEETEA